MNEVDIKSICNLIYLVFKLSKPQLEKRFPIGLTAEGIPKLQDSFLLSTSNVLDIGIGYKSILLN